MPTTNITPANIQWVGLAKEATYGTPIATPTVWVPISDPKWKPVIKQLKNEALYGDMAKTHGQVPGVRHDTLDYKFGLFLDTFFQHMNNILGTADAVSGSADPYTHKTSLLNSGDGQPDSYTLFAYNGSECWQLPGAQLAQVEVDVKANESASASVQWMSLPAVKLSSVPTGVSYTTAQPMPTTTAVITVGGTAVTNHSDVKLTYKRDTEAVETLTGTQSPFKIYVGQLEAMVDLTAVYQGYGNSGDELIDYLTNVQPAVTVQVTPNGDTHYVQWQHSQVAFDDVEVTGSTKWMELSGKAEAIANATDALGGGQSPVLFSMTSSQSTAF